MMQRSRVETVSGKTIDLNQSPALVYNADSIPTATKPAPATDRQFRELVGILRRRFGLVAAIATAGAFVAAIVGMTISPRYIATAYVMIEPPNAGERAARQEMEETVDTHMTLLKSRDHLQRVVDSLSRDFGVLPATPPAGQSARDEGLSSINGSNGLASESETARSILDRVRQRSSIWLAPLWPAGGRVVPTVEQFEGGTKVIQERRSRVISVAYVSGSPEKAAAFVNRIVQLYVDDLTEHRLAAARAELARLREQIAEAKFEMERDGLAVQEAIQERLSAPDLSLHENQADRRLQNLEREASASAQLYGSLLRRQKEMRAQQEAESSRVSVRSLASVPDRPSSHNPLLFIVPAFFIFAIGGGWIAVALDKLDRGMRSEKATSEALGIPCIGLIPRLSHKLALRPYQLFRKAPFSAFSEALRSTAATLQLLDSGGCKVVLVTSSIHGEGKTSLALALAGFVAGLGRRVLLIDLDLRSGHNIGALVKKPDISIVAKEVHDPNSQNGSVSEIVKRLPDEGPDCLSITHDQLDPIAPFANDYVARLVQQQREKYDCVIIDGPPVLGAAEARLLRPTVDQVLYAVQWGKTKQEVARNALDLLRGSGGFDKQHADFIVAILTKVDLRKHVRYGYGDATSYLVTRETKLR